ncbi:hypothetical protein KDW_47920 [Dictyobacter vulcani]|uniref:Protein kinase domain-containing protein n=1 Tax=Dictyobacter vulcani TaxID=2607529 RepID=A0A5J4KVT1_9CHLR|nr:serine/threonine-protein kinase [Dictyobacter vulcani]GER90630.1 hypothetical protein KDW_47920 [Dictyobacter vulcani]
MSSYPGKQLGNYRLIRLLGEGAFARVYLGEHIYLGTQAAIKVLKMEAANGSMDGFYIEARNIARLIHPHIVRVLDFGVEGTTPFLVLDYASSGTLRQRHPNGTPVPLAVVVSYIKQIAEALQYAHDEKLIHRDIKPENILLGRRNEVLLSDFGIALLMQTVQAQNIQDVAGTLPYMAPEQIQGQPRQASDQYSLGIMAYEWLTGYRPFYGSITEVVAQQLSIAPSSLREKVPTLPEAVEQVVFTALAKDYNRRFGSIQAFATALEQASRLATPDSAQLEKTTVPVMPTVIVPPARKETESQLRSQMSGGKPQPPGTRVCSYQGHQHRISALSWSPNGKRIVSASHEKLIQVWDTTTGKPQQTFQDPATEVRLVAWSTDGLRIASAGSDGQVHIWNAGTGRSLLTYAGHHGHNSIHALAWSPIQPVIASAASDGTVHVWDATTSKQLTIYRGHRNSVHTLAWTPPGPASTQGHGYHIVSGGEDTSLQTWEAFTGKQIAFYAGPPAPIMGAAWSPAIYPAFTSPGPGSQTNKSSRVGCGRLDGMIQMWDTTSHQEVLSYRYPAPISVIAWSPDGRRFAYASEDTMVEVWDTTTNLKLLTFSHSAPIRVLVWSPDGKYIATGGDDTKIHIWTAP